MRVSDDLLAYYERELDYLRDQGAEFARRYPQVAGRLALGGSESPDPHTERLIEASAFLAARVHRDLDREFPQVAAALLDNLCPSLAQPVPSMSVAEIRLDPAQGKVTAGFAVPRHTVLVARGASGEPCRMRTAWDSVLWPLQVAEARISEGRELRIRLRCDEGTDLAELELDALRLHLHGDWTVTMPLYELLVGGVASVAVRTGQGALHPLSTRQWREVGFADGEAVLPLPPHAPPAYALLQEYFAFPRKFHFFEVSGLRGRLGHGRECELCLTLRGSTARLGRLDAQVLRTGCVPVVNLFPRTSEPIRIDHRRHEHLLAGDRLREASTEVHTIVSVLASEPDADRVREVPPFAALDPAGAAGGVFWSARREPSLRADIPGSDVWLSFVDPAQAPARPAEPVVYAKLLCTNRRLAEQMQAGTAMRAEGLSSALQIRCLYPPTAQRAAPLAADAMWRLVALLRLNHGSLVSCDDGGQALRGMLRLFADDSARELAQIAGIRSLRARPGTARIGTDGWRGHCRGTEVEIEFDEQAFVGGSPLLMSAVLARFFALYTTLNAFVRLTVRRRDEVWKQWDPMTGRQVLL